MALRNDPAAAAVAKPQPSAPAFEAMDEGQTSNVAHPDQPANDPAPAPAAANSAAAGTSVAAPASTAVAVVDGSAAKFAEEVAAMKGAADFAWGNYTVFKGIQGSIKNKEKNISFGRYVKGTMIAWDDHYEISPSSETEKSKEYMAFSKEGKVVDRVVGEELRHWVGKPCEEYLTFLKEEEDYTKANFRRFIDVAFVVHESDSNDDLNGEIVQITLSQSSIPSFSRYQEKLQMKARAVARKVPGVKIPEDPFTFYFLRQDASAKGNDWTKLEVLDKLPAKL